MRWTENDLSASFDSDDGLRAFCTETGWRRLQDQGVSASAARKVLRAVMERLHPGVAIATPEIWTTAPSNELFSVIGRITRDGKIIGKGKVVLAAKRGELHLVLRSDRLASIAERGADDLVWDAWANSGSKPASPSEYMLCAIPLGAPRLAPEIERLLDHQRAQTEKEVQASRAKVHDAFRFGAVTPSRFEEVFPERACNQDGRSRESAGASLEPPRAAAWPPALPAVSSGSQPPCAAAEHSFGLTEVFEPQPAEPSRRIDFLNVAFPVSKSARHDSRLHGPGLYGLFFTPTKGEERLIYVGSFLGEWKSAQNLFAGNVAKARWWTHVASMTMRGNDISIARATRDNLAGVLADHPDHLFNKLLREPAVVTLGSEGNCVAGLRRVIFAFDHWDVFSEARPVNLMRPFRFGYVRLTALGQQSPAVLRDTICTAEDKLIHQLKPRCNRQTSLDRSSWREDVGMTEFLTEARILLCAA